jgi:D-alanyl-D-alanine carboxypeptidase
MTSLNLRFKNYSRHNVLVCCQSRIRIQFLYLYSKFFQMNQYFIYILLSLFILSACKQGEGLNEIQNNDPAEIPSDAHISYDSAAIQFIMGHFEPEDHEDFVTIDPKYADKEGRLLHKETYAAFIKMYEAALQDSVKLIIRSATRNFDYQKGIWERKWTGVTRIEEGTNAAETYPDHRTRALKILEYSSMPGSSRHHWGTDIDLNNFENEWFETGEGLKIFNWLEENAATFGFCRPYTMKGPERPNGYNEEKWHWSYVPLAKKLSDIARVALKNEMITGFMGDSTATKIDVVSNYVLGINKECL